jgi:hypothetical protein
VAISRITLRCQHDLCSKEGIFLTRAQLLKALGTAGKGGGCARPDGGRFIIVEPRSFIEKVTVRATRTVQLFRFQLEVEKPIDALNQVSSATGSAIALLNALLKSTARDLTFGVLRDPKEPLLSGLFSTTGGPPGSRSQRLRIKRPPSSLFSIH